MLCSEHYGRLYRKTIVEWNNMGERLQGVESDIRMLEDPSETDKRVERECNVIEYRSETRNGDAIESQYQTTFPLLFSNFSKYS